MTTLDHLRQLRDSSAEERVAEAQAFTREYQEAIDLVRRNAPYASIPARVTRWLESCSEASFSSFVDYVRGKRRATPTRKVS